MIPGEIRVASGDILLNDKRKTVSLAVTNSGDRPIQVGSHYHFFETNDALKFERKKAYGCRLNIAAGTAVRFEPGQTRTVEVIPLAGARNGAADVSHGGRPCSSLPANSTSSSST